jgi:hypothetical protein
MATVVHLKFGAGKNSGWLYSETTDASLIAIPRPKFADSFKLTKMESQSLVRGVAKFCYKWRGERVGFFVLIHSL